MMGGTGGYRHHDYLDMIMTISGKSFNHDGNQLELDFAWLAGRIKMYIISLILGVVSRNLNPSSLHASSLT